MATGRVTRSKNKSLPRKRCTDEVDSAYIESNAPSIATFSTDNDTDGSVVVNRRSSTSKSSPNRNRKQPAKRAAQKGKGVADSPAKKQRTKGHTSRARKETPQLLWSALNLGDSPEPELPDLPASTYAPSGVGEWVGFSDEIIHAQNERSQAADVPGGSSKHTEVYKDAAWTNGSTVEMLRATLAARQAPGGMDHAQGARLRRSMSRRSRSRSIEWVDLGNRASERIEEQPPTLEQLQAQSEEQSLRSEKLVRLAMEVITDEAQSHHDEDFEAWVADNPEHENEDGEEIDDDSPIAAVRNDSEEDGGEREGDGGEAEAQLLGEEAMDVDEADETNELQDEEPPDEHTRTIHDGNAQTEAAAHSHSDEDGFDVDFEDDGEVKDMYDIGDTSEREDTAQPQRDEESLFVQDVQGSDNVGSVPHGADPGDENVSREVESEDEERRHGDRDGDKDEHDQSEEEDEENPEIPSTRRDFASSQANPRTPPATLPLRRKRSPQPVRFRPSEYIEPTEGSHMAVVKSQDLETLLRCMKTRTWTGEGPRWEAELLSGYNRHVSVPDLEEINTERRRTNRPPLSDNNHPSVRWYNDHRSELKTAKARELGQHVYHAWRTCRDAPSADNLGAQTAYFTNGAGKGFRKTLDSCDNYVDYVCTRLPNGDPEKATWAGRMRKSLTYRLIPLIVILLKEAFLLAEIQPKNQNTRLDHVQDLPRMIDATDFHLQTLLIIMGWLNRLCSAMISDYEQNAPELRPADWEIRKKQRWDVMSLLHRFEDALKKAVDEIAEAAGEPARKAQAAEHDRHLRELRESKVQKDREARDRQRQLFYTSLQPTPSQSRSSVPSSAPTYGFSQSLQQPPKRKRLSAKEKYAAENDGWYWDEDDTLMNALKRVDKPSASGLAELLPGRTAEQVKKRLMELREIGRKHYEKKRMAIPRWCQGYGWR